MLKKQLKTPIIFLIFNRPDTTAQVFEEIAKSKPSTLLVIADGPRAGYAGEEERCAITRSIIDKVNWSCTVFKNYSNINLGCKGRVSSGLNWAFEKVDEAIILEDDCLPDQSFFEFCEELLNKYRYDKRIMSISGNNFQFGRSVTTDSYYFSHYPHIWGWATWKRAWQLYDLDMKHWPKVQEYLLKGMVLNSAAKKSWLRIFNATYNGKIDTWDYQWVYSSWLQNGLSILPSTTLVTNLGFGKGATHTTTITPFANMQTKPMDFPLRHPEYFLRNTKADEWFQNTHLSPNIATRIWKKINSLKG
ncbi:hypothetical protein [Anthocerotibacter panamensis]|uniref:hypothetical protein n=1 Tax=Anthocerotibacter panamensis TaxID=2857077 RepID=UPI001C406C14|nr:hypothetical protein [Anthocerotibacter panamensis]